MQIVNDRSPSVDSTNVDRLADFIMFAQRSFLLDLSKELNNGNISADIRASGSKQCWRETKVLAA